ncbi:glycosyltransferase family 61 protein [Halomonas alimentaria]|uniref:glycosyltransferase family 61 protein n=1 Tax=Halomonas alimentaria TaxID=147248 RepID=UPI002492B2E2|nr:glycosyltransferase family 61 protein [Halomonas alimentaria]
MSDEIFNQPWPEEFEPRVECHHDVTATSLGTVFCKSRPLAQTLYAYPYSMFKGVALSYASCMKRWPEQLDMDCMPAFIHSQWSKGYFHWVTESLPRAIILRDKFPDACVLLPKYYNTFHSDSLSLLDVNCDYFPSHNLKLSYAAITSCPRHYGTTDQSLLLRVSEEVRGRVSSKLNYGDKVYISRRKSRGRFVINESQVVQLLEKYGFVELVPEDYSFAEQVAIFSKAKFLVSIHGAGLTNMVFMPPGGAVLELVPFRNGVFDLRPNSFSFKHDDCYLTLSRKMGHEYSFLQCGHDKGKYSRTNLSNIFVDCEMMGVKVEHLLNLGSK